MAELGKSKPEKSLLPLSRCGGADRNFLTGRAGKDMVFFQSTGGNFNPDLKVVTVLGNNARGWLGFGNPEDSAELYTRFSIVNDNPANQQQASA
jgi:hypothetical protein